MNKAIFLDKDGTLVKNIPYNGNPRRITLLPTVAKGLFLLQQREYKLIIITNQSGIAQGFFSLQDLLEVEKSLRRIFLGFFIHIDGFYFCPHHPKGEIALYRQYCWCRKPAPGLIQQAAKDHHIDLRASWMIG